MMTKIKVAFIILAAITCTAFMVSISIPAYAVSTFYDRNIYSLKEINDGALGDAITFNSIIVNESTDSEWIGEGTLQNETNFVGARVDDDNHGKYNKWEGTEIEAVDGETYIVRLYVHNNSPLGEDATAEDVKVRFYIPSISGNEVEVQGWLTSSNATPNQYADTVVFQSEDGTPFHLEYVEGSALLENGGFASGAGVQLSDSVVYTDAAGANGANFADAWTLIGYNGLDGKVPGCYAYTNYVSIEVKAVYDQGDREFTVEKKARVVGAEDQSWQYEVDAEIGDEVEFRIEYKNISGGLHSDVAVRDLMPENLEYVEGSTRLWMSATGFKDGPYLNTDDLIANGLNIGAFTDGSNAIIRFKATVVDNSLAYGSNNLVNWVQVNAGMTNKVTLQDYACVTVYKDTKFQVVSSVLLGAIIILSIAIAILLYKIFKKH